MLADIGAGIRLGPLYYAAWQDGHKAFPAGTCPAVGAGGHLLGEQPGVHQSNHINFLLFSDAACASVALSTTMTGLHHMTFLAAACEATSR